MPDPAHCPPCCGPPPPFPCLSVCWLCAGAPGAGFSEILGWNAAASRFEGKNSRATVSGNTATIQRLCNGVWQPDPGVPVPVNPATQNPPFAQVPDTCCACGTALVCVTNSCNILPGCGLGCEFGIFASPYNQLPADWDVPIGASLTNANWNSCPAMANTYTVSGSACNWQYNGQLGIIMPGQNCGWTAPCGRTIYGLNPPCPTDLDHLCCQTTLFPQNPPACDPNSIPACFDPCNTGYGGGCGSCGVNISLTFVPGNCGGVFKMTITFGCTGFTYPNNEPIGYTSCQATATYTSDFFPAISAVPSSVKMTGGGPAGPACNGSMPGTITITAA